jgi:DNA-binding transcriptional MerR regulator
MAERITARDAATVLGVSMRTLSRLDERGVTRPFQFVPHGTRWYDPDDLQRLLNRDEQQPT